MTQQHECSICLDKLECMTNFVMTECGHCFHTNCLMTNVAHNGFGCPYCRSAMAQTVEDSDDEDDDDNWIQDEEEDNDHALTSFRMFHQRLSGEEVEEEDDDEDTDDDEEEEDEDETPPVVRPSSTYITKKLTEHGVSMEDLVKIMMGDHAEYDDFQDSPQISQLEGWIFGKFRIIISNFKIGDELPHPQHQVAQTISNNVVVRRGSN